MDFRDVSLTALRVFRAVAEQGAFTKAAAQTADGRHGEQLTVSAVQAWTCVF